MAKYFKKSLLFNVFLLSFCFSICVLLCVLPFYLRFQLYFSLFSFFNACFLFLICVSFICFLFCVFGPSGPPYDVLIFFLLLVEF